MDYEKKYRDLVEAVKELQEANPSDEGIQKWVEDNVPELKESEEGDEKIRKEIIDFIYDKTDTYELREKSNSWLAWLEKHEKIEQKPVEWSEDDEQILQDIIYNIRLEATKHLPSPLTKGKNETNLYIDWLKFLKYRVQPQPKQEWSKEDEENFASINYACLKVYGGDSYPSDWLRKFLGIHKKWKPSNEQIEVLHDVAAYIDNSIYPNQKDILINLYLQLKKLKEG